MSDTDSIALKDHWNPWLPDRPRKNNKGEFLHYRTTFDEYKTKKPKIYDIFNMRTQVRLYQAVRQDYIPQQVVIADLHENLFSGTAVSKHVVGQVVCQSTIYNPRKLINRKETGVVVTYCFGDILELQYGLEWMICSWYHKFLRISAPRDAQITDKDGYAEELDILASSDMDETDADFLENGLTWAKQHREPDWAEVIGNYKEWTAPSEQVSPKPVPRFTPKQSGR